LKHNAAGAVIEITEEMRFGKRPDFYNLNAQSNSKYVNYYKNLTAGNGKLLLVHGYCSGPVWPPQDFTNAVVFQDYSKSRSNDEFALMIRSFGEQYSSFGIVAHSQGGLASLHLKTYYWSGLDIASTGQRLIQSVGSPYRGCSLAGVLASIGALFGFGCGRNFDLSTDGAALWYSKIPKFQDGPEKTVYYYTTRYDEGWWIFSNCVTAANLVLYAPNDGTCELKFASLTSGNNMGTTQGWCHASGMKYPPQCSDPSRNKIMDSAAAR